MQHYPSGEITSSKPGLIHPIQYTDYFSSPSFHIYNIHYQYVIYTYTHTHQRSMEELSTTMLKCFRSLKVLLSLPGGLLCATHLLRRTCSWKSSVFQPCSPPLLPLLNMEGNCSLCQIPFKWEFVLQVFVFLKGSPAGKPSWAGCCDTNVPTTSPYPPKSSQMQLPRVWSCRGKGWRKVVHPLPPFPYLYHDILIDQTGFPFFKTRRLCY